MHFRKKVALTMIICLVLGLISPFSWAITQHSDDEMIGEQMKSISSTSDNGEKNASVTESVYGNTPLMVAPMGAPPFAGGAGTSGDPYQIETPAHLNNVRDYLDKHFILMNDIDLDVSPYNSGEGWEPIGTGAAPFTGVLDGDGHAIENLFINRTNVLANGIGLFGNSNNATFKNMRIESVNISGQSNAAALVGKGITTTIENVGATGMVTGNGYVAGLVGQLESNSAMSHSFAAVDITGSLEYLGGLIGYSMYDNTIENCYATGSVTSTGGNGNVGGLIGRDTGGEIINCYATGAVSAPGRWYVGGLMGWAYGSTITNGYAHGAVEGARHVGGLLGRSSDNSHIRYTYAVGEVAATEDHGGLIGSVEAGKPGTILDSFYDADTSQQSDTGKGTPKTTVAMKAFSLYVGWDFNNVWGFNSMENNGYPFLKWQGYDDTRFAGGSGTSVDPYQIETPEHLNNMRGSLAAHFVLRNPIDLDVPPYNSGEGWEPIGTLAAPFTGVLDGDGHAISHLFIRRDENFTGLFGSARDATFKDTTLEEVDIIGHTYTGGLIGYADGFCHIDGILVSGSVFGGHHGGSVGGLVGQTSHDTTISNSHANNIEVRGVDNVGGLVGQTSHDTTISNSHANNIEVRGVGNVGGLVGYSWSSITNSSAQGRIEYREQFGAPPVQQIGGLVGYAYQGGIEDSFADVDVIGWNYTGGLVGRSFSTLINNAYATGNVESYHGNDVGGLVGSAEGNTIIHQSYATGNSTGRDQIGGLVGHLQGSSQINDGYSLGNVAGAEFVGGLVGKLDNASLNQVYAIGEITNTGAGTRFGGLVGIEDGNITNGFYNQNTSGMADDDGRGVPKTTAELQEITTFQGWDFDTIWDIHPSLNAGYPFLRWQGLATTHTVTYDANGADSGAVPVDVNGPYLADATVTVLDNTDLVKAGHDFNGWNTASDGSGSFYAAGETFTINSNTTLFAQWEPSDSPSTPGSGGSGGGGGGGGGTPSPPATKETVINAPVETGTGDETQVVSQVQVTRTEERGRVTDVIRFQVAEAKEAIQKAGEHQHNLIRLHVPAMETAPDEILVNLSPESLGEMADAAMDLEIVTPTATVVIPADALKSLASQETLGDDLYFRVVPIVEEQQRQALEKKVPAADAVQQAASGRPVTLLGQPSTIETNMGSHQVEVLLPFTEKDLPTNEASTHFLENLYVYIQHTDGTTSLKPVTVRSYSSSERAPLAASFHIDKFSQFTLLYIEPATIMARFFLDSDHYLVGDTTMEMDTVPLVTNGRTLLPIRYVAYAVGIDPSDIEWDAATRRVSLQHNETFIEITLNELVIKRGEAHLPLEVPATIHEGRTMLPLRALSEVLGHSVEWQEEERAIVIYQ